MARILLIAAAVIAVVLLAFMVFHLVYVGVLILLVGMLAFSMFRIGRFAGRGPRQ